MFFEKMQTRKNDGFTLVELIVVIAILAILAGIGVPAYSGYVEKANMAADQQLASEVANALTLYYYDNYETPVSGYVTISKSGVTTSNGDMSNAMAAVFGDVWQQDANLKLKGDWTGATGTSMLSYAIDRATSNMEATQKVADSTFLNEASTDGMLNALTNLTGIVNGVINDYGTGNKVTEKLGSVLGEGFVTKLDGTGVKNDSADYNTVVSNMMVGYFADALHNNSAADPDLAEMVAGYASLYAYAETTGDLSLIEAVNNNLKAVTSTDDLVVGTLTKGLENDPRLSKFDKYLEERGETDFAATMEIMGALAEISGSYTDAESLSNKNLYNSDTVKNQANEYVNAVKIVAGMDTDALTALKTSAGSGNVVVSMAGGIAAVSPAMF